MIVAGDEIDDCRDVGRRGARLEQGGARAASRAARTRQRCGCGTSSPMCSACAMSGLTGISPWISNALRRAGASTFAIHVRRAITSGLLAPKRSTLPRPSFRLENARLPCFAFRTIQTGIDGLMIPDIGPTAARVMAWRERDVAARGHLARAAGVARPPFVQDGADDRAAHRPAHARPRDGRARVKDGAVRHARKHFASNADARQHGLRGEVGLARLVVGRFDGGRIDEPRERVGDGGIPARRRLPVHLRRFASRAFDSVRERREADVQHRKLAAEQRLARGDRLARQSDTCLRAIAAARRTACALLSARIMPAERSVASWRA